MPVAAAASGRLRTAARPHSQLIERLLAERRLDQKAETDFLLGKLAQFDHTEVAETYEGVAKALSKTTLTGELTRDNQTLLATYMIVLGFRVNALLRELRELLGETRVTVTVVSEPRA
jgi:hypothetical protein